MALKRLLLCIATLLFAAAAQAAVVEERSPFRQGHWWDPTRSGHGFELLSNAGQVFAVWYTYDAEGRPTWYTAQGTDSTLGADWPLMKHRWAGEGIAQSTPVGRFRLVRETADRMQAHWSLGSQQGAWTIEPFIASGMMNEVDLTGHWYVPSNTGWGMTLVDQGEVFGAVIYAYDADGAPTWVAGFDRGKGTRIDLYRTTGTCPSCTYVPPATAAAGRIDIEYRGDTEITVRGTPAIELAQGVRIDGAQAFQLGRPISSRPADFRLVPFAGEAALKDYLALGTENRLFWSGADFSPAPPAPAVDFSTTNLQESGVDEADLVKSNGRYVYTFAHAASGTGSVVRVADVRGDGSAVEVRGEFAIDSALGYDANRGLYLHGNTLVALTSGYLHGWLYSPPLGSVTSLEVMSLANPAAPSTRWRARLAGNLVTSRRIGDRLYVVTRFTPDLPGLIHFPRTEAQRAANRALVAATPLASLLPSISVNGGPYVPAVAISAIHAPPGSRKASADFVVVSAFDLAQPRLTQALAIAGYTDAVYVSTENLYVATGRHENRNGFGSLLPAEPSMPVLDIHKIRIDASDMRVVASGSVEGRVDYDIDKAAFRFGEHAGRLRVVTSSTNMWGGLDRNRLTVLEPSSVSPGLLKAVAVLPNRRRPETLGKPGELLYGTRFVGDRLYAVTFKKTDPLYVVDLSVADDPRIAGALEVPGFSDYLHPMADGLLLGFGKDAVPAGVDGDGGFAWFQGLHVTLFDVSNPSAPREIQRVIVGKRGSHSALLQSHRAFSALRRADGTTSIGIPARIYDGPAQSSPTASYPWRYSGLLRFDVRGSGPGDASLVQRPSLVTHSPLVLTPAPDAASHSGRSVLFPDAAVYVGEGRFWRQDANGTTFGPY